VSIRCSFSLILAISFRSLSISSRRSLALRQPGAERSAPGWRRAKLRLELIDRDLKLMAKIKEKEQRMDTASQNLRENWDRSKGRKR
jgi:hypothetical protein